MKTIKLGFDIHGVLDANPNFFKWMIKGFRLLKNSCGINVEIHVITGSKYSEKLENQLKNLFNTNNIWWDKFFSIQQYCENNYDDQAIFYEGLERPNFPDKIWDEAKGIYCKKENIDIHFDDQEDYFKTFETNGFLYKDIKRETNEGLNVSRQYNI